MSTDSQIFAIFYSIFNQFWNEKPIIGNDYLSGHILKFTASQYFYPPADKYLKSIAQHASDDKIDTDDKGDKADTLHHKYLRFVIPPPRLSGLSSKLSETLLKVQRHWWKNFESHEAV